ncbi:hypothetical protein R1sor_018759 [Riccia sorocarpa]|uniref:Uncharacterized protein n=1 Tax=Riccia sorocarpa TaxID=122646 RepID=A0ABD3IES9_9MARC
METALETAGGFPRVEVCEANLRELETERQLHVEEWDAKFKAAYEKLDKVPVSRDWHEKKTRRVFRKHRYKILEEEKLKMQQRSDKKVFRLFSRHGEQVEEVAVLTLLNFSRLRSGAVSTASYGYPGVLKDVAILLRLHDNTLKFSYCTP